MKFDVGLNLSVIVKLRAILLSWYDLGGNSMSTPLLLTIKEYVFNVIKFSNH